MQEGERRTEFCHKNVTKMKLSYIPQKAYWNWLFHHQYQTSSFMTLPRLLTSAVAFTFALSSPLWAVDTIVIDGSSTVFPITKLAGKAYEEETKGKVKVDVSYSGTTGGFRKFVKGEIDIADASRPILKEEINAAKANGIEYVEIPIAYDALTIAVNPKNKWLNSITTSELKKLWEPDAQEKITKWNQINPDWPDEEITIFGAGTDSGTYDYFAEVIVGGKKLRPDFIGSEDDVVLVDGIASNPNALGFIPYSYVFEAKDKIKPIAITHDIDIKTGQALEGEPIMPSTKAVYEGIYTPLGRPLFIYVNVKSYEEKPYLANFLKFFMGNAASFIHEAHYLPLSEIAYRTAIKNLNSKKTGTRFNGEPATGIAHHSIFTLQPK